VGKTQKKQQTPRTSERSRPPVRGRPHIHDPALLPGSEIRRQPQKGSCSPHAACRSSNPSLIETNPMKKMALNGYSFIFFLTSFLQLVYCVQKTGTLTPIGTTGSGTVKVSNLICPDFTRPSPKTMGVYFCLFSPLTCLLTSQQTTDLIESRPATLRESRDCLFTVEKRAAVW
jgi:hypothetical protein